LGILVPPFCFPVALLSSAKSHVSFHIVTFINNFNLLKNGIIKKRDKIKDLYNKGDFYE